jgi:hypothetical protein
MSAIQWLWLAIELMLVWLCVFLGVGAFSLYWLLVTGRIPL